MSAAEQSRHLEMSPTEVLNFLAATATAHAESYLHGRLAGGELAVRASMLLLELVTLRAPVPETAVLHLLLNVMLMASTFHGPRAERWRDILEFMARKARQESLERLQGVA